MEIRGYGDANPVLYQILKHMDDDKRKLLEDKLKRIINKNLRNIKSLKKNLTKQNL